MKKVCKLFLVLLIALVVFGCSSNGGNTPIKSKKIIEDVDLMKLHFEVPETYDSVDRFCDYLADGQTFQFHLLFPYDHNPINAINHV